MPIKNLLGRLLWREKIGPKNVSTDAQETLDRLWWFMTKLPDWSWAMKSYKQETKTSDLWLTEAAGGVFAHLWKDWSILTNKETFYILDYINRAKNLAIKWIFNHEDSFVSRIKFEYNKEVSEKWPQIIFNIEDKYPEDPESWEGSEISCFKPIPIIDDKILNKIPEWEKIKEIWEEIVKYLNKWAEEKGFDRIIL